MTDTETIAACLREATPQSAAQLRDLADDTASKETRKEARRALYLLSQKGILPAPPTPATNAFPSQAPPPDTLQAWASAFDGAGNRLIFLLVPDTDGGSPTLMQILINDVEGVKEYDAERLSRRQVTERIQLYENQRTEGLAFASLPPDYARWLLEKSRVRSHQLRRMTPPGFLDTLARIGQPRVVPERSLIYEHLPLETLDLDDYPRTAEEFFQLPWFAPWFFAVEDIVPWLRQIHAWEQKKQEVPEEEARQHRAQLFTEALENLLNPEMRANYVFRLEESAEILRRMEEIPSAKAALWQARELAEDKPVSDSTFARDIMTRTLAAAVEILMAENQEDNESTEDEDDGIASE